MASGSSAQKKKKELKARRERKAVETMRAAATTTTRPEAVGDITLVPIPSLEETNPSVLGDVGGGTDSDAGEGDDGHPLSIRTKRGPMEPEVVDMTTGKKVKGQNLEKRGIVTGTTTAYLKSQPLKVEYAEEHKGPKELKCYMTSLPPRQACGNISTRPPQRFTGIGNTTSILITLKYQRRRSKSSSTDLSNRSTSNLTLRTTIIRRCVPGMPLTGTKERIRGMQSTIILAPLPTATGSLQMRRKGFWCLYSRQSAMFINYPRMQKRKCGEEEDG